MRDLRLRPDQTWLVSNHTGWVLEGGTLYPVKKVLPVPYHGIYQTDEVIPRSRVLTFLARELPTLERHLPVEMEMPADLFVTVPGNPVFHLELKGTRASLRATLRAAAAGSMSRLLMTSTPTHLIAAVTTSAISSINAVCNRRVRTPRVTAIRRLTLRASNRL